MSTSPVGNLKTSPVSIVLLDAKLDQPRKLPDEAASKIPTATMVPQSPVAVGNSTADALVAAAPVVVKLATLRV